MPCVKSPPRTWRRKGNALLRIASDPACSDGPFDKPKFNWINCVRGGRRYSLQAQGDFCGTAYIGFIIAGAFGGFAGVFWAYYNGFVSPTDVELATSVEILLMVALGGRGTLLGPALGAG